MVQTNRPYRSAFSKFPLIIGLHAPVALGHAKALERVNGLRCKSIQILPYRRHHLPTEVEISEFLQSRRMGQIEKVIIHSRYVPCLASSDHKRRVGSVKHLVRELKITMALKADAYVIHAGAYSTGGNFNEAVQLFSQSIREAMDQTGYRGEFLIENVPGGGRRIGGSLEELSALFEGVSPRLIKPGLCLDTAHAWAAGYDLSKAESILKWLSKSYRLFGHHVLAFHLNDTIALLGSHLENHAHWGKGYLGQEILDVLFSREEFINTPAILETPNEPGADQKNLDYVRQWLAKQ